MLDKALLLSFSVGLLTSSPLGPIGMLCLRRILAHGAVSGLVSALGIACAYAFWAYVAVHGLAVIADWMQQEKQVLQIGIGLFFLLYGLHSIYNAPSTVYSLRLKRSNATEFLSTFLVVLLNPATLLTYSALFTLFGVASSRITQWQAINVALCAFAGSLSFWLIVERLVRNYRHRLSEDTYRMTSRFSSWIILSFGIVTLLYGIEQTL